MSKNQNESTLIEMEDMYKNKDEMDFQDDINNNNDNINVIDDDPANQQTTTRNQNEILNDAFAPQRRRQHTLPLNELIDCICEFLEVATHSILYYRYVYPRAFFEMRKQYNLPVPMSRSALVCDYVAVCIKQLKKVLLKGIAEKVVIGITNDAGSLLERFVFELDLTSGFKPDSAEFAAPATTLAQIQANFRAFLLKLSVSQALLQPVTGATDERRGNGQALKNEFKSVDDGDDDGERDYGLSFNFIVHCSDGDAANEDESISQNWVPANAASFEESFVLIPFKSANFGRARIQLFVEEDRASKEIARNSNKTL